MPSKSAFFLLLPLGLAGCLAQSEIQAKYMEQESTCHNVAERSIDARKTAQDAAYIAGTAFSECMAKSGWKVATPKPPKGTNVAETPPIGPSTSGGIPGGSASGAAARQAPPGTGTTDGTTTPAAPVLGPGVQPNPAPASEAIAPSPGPSPATPAQPQPTTPAPYYPQPAAPQVSAPTPASSGVSTYQPARPQGVEMPNYGSGAGRNF